VPQSHPYGSVTSRSQELCWDSRLIAVKWAQSKGRDGLLAGGDSPGIGTVRPMVGPASGSEISVEIVEAVSETFESASELARAFAAPVCEPTWWPTDVGKISYVVDRFPGADRAGRDQYRIGSMRHDGVPIFVIGHREVPGAGRADGEWYAPRELATVRGLIGRVGIPRRLQAVVHQEGLAVHLVGYGTEAEILSAARSLRHIDPV
jgi:hypothetical protein